MRTLTWIGLVVAGVVTACSRGPSDIRPQPALSRPLTPPALVPPATDLTGTWATGTGAEPTATAITLYPGCTTNPAVWIIEQTGNDLKAWAFAESYNQGVVARGPGPARIAASPGWISGVDVFIDDGQDRYALRFDVESKHLRGTRNGNPFWAVRQHVVRREACPGVPAH